MNEKHILKIGNLHIQQTGAIPTECRIVFDGIEIHPVSLQLNMRAREVPTVLFEVLVSEIDIELDGIQGLLQVKEEA
jgi:hypothetical protein